MEGYPSLKFASLLPAIILGSCACPSTPQVENQPLPNPAPLETNPPPPPQRPQRPQDAGVEHNFPIDHELSQLTQGWKTYFQRQFERAVNGDLSTAHGPVPEQITDLQQIFEVCSQLQRIFNSVLALTCANIMERLPVVSEKEHRTEVAWPTIVAFQKPRQNWEAWMPFLIKGGTAESRFIHAQCLEEARRAMADKLRELRPRLPHRSKFIGFLHGQDYDDYAHGVDCGVMTDPPPSFRIQKSPPPIPPPSTPPSHPEKNRPPQKIREPLPGKDRPSLQPRFLNRRRYE